MSTKDSSVSQETQCKNVFLEMRGESTSMLQALKQGFEVQGSPSQAYRNLSLNRVDFVISSLVCHSILTTHS
jgi:hypothetical protein